YLFDNLDITGSFVIDPGGATVIAYRSGKPLDFDLMAHAIGLTRLAAQARASTANPPETQAGLITIDGKLEVVAVSRIAPDQPMPASRRGAGHVLAFSRVLDAAALDQLGAGYGVRGLRQVSADAAMAQPTMLRLVSADGTPLGTLIWEPKNPGQMMIRGL